LSGKNLLAQGRQLLYGYLCYLILTYIALMVDGLSIGQIWDSHALLPPCAVEMENWLSIVIGSIGMLLLAIFVYYGCLTVARLSFEELKGNYFFPLKEAARDAKPGLRVFVVAVIILGLMVVVFSLLQAVVALIALIPGVGEIIYALIYGMPLFIWSLFIVFVAFGLTTAFLTLPAIITLSEKESFGATFYIYNVIWTQPLRWFSLTAISFALAKVGTFVLGYFFMRALQLSNYAAGLFAGDKMQGIISAANGMMAKESGIIGFFTTLYPGSAISFDWLTTLGATEASGSAAVAAVIMYIILILIAFVVLSYGLNVITAGQVIAGLLVRYYEDNEKLTEELEIEESGDAEGGKPAEAEPPKEEPPTEEKAD
jgi:hypothetical protein